MTDTPDGDTETEVPTRRSTGSRGLQLAAAVLAVIALLSTSAFAYLSLQDNGGTNSPDAAAAELFQAAVRGDLLGVVSLLAPSEREVLASSIPELATQLERLGLISHFDGHVVTGTTLSTDSLQFRDERLAEDIIAVDVVVGRLTFESEDAKTPLTDSARTILGFDFGIDSKKGTVVRDFAQHPLRLVVVNENGSWHISLAYSVAESLRGGAGASPATFGKGPGIRGSSTPDASVRELLGAYAAGDVNRSVGQLLPHEARALYDYAVLFIPPDPRSIEERNKGKDPRAIPLSERLALTYQRTIDRLDLTTDGSGSSRRVRVRALEVTIVGEVMREHLSYDGTCLGVDYRFAEKDPPFARFNSCGKAAVTATAPRSGTAGTVAAAKAEPRRLPTLDGGVDLGGRPAGGGETEADRERESGGGHPPADNLFSRAAVFGAGGGELPAFTVVQRDGLWFVSPARTVTDTTIETMKALSPDGSEGAIRRARSLFALPGTEIEDEAKDPDNGLFGPGATARNRLVSACFVEVLSRAGDLAMSSFGPDCVRQLIADGRVRGDTIAPLLLGECYQAKPTAPPAVDPPFRRIYLITVAVRTCVQRAVDDGEVPDYLVKDIIEPQERACFGPYQKLARTAPEAEWVAADQVVQTCAARVTHDPPSDPTTPAPR